MLQNEVKKGGEERGAKRRPVCPASCYLLQSEEKTTGEEGRRGERRTKFLKFFI
jgi:hypothetical protein